MRLKYVIIDDCYPVLFTEANQHSAFRQADGRGATSAGFFDLHAVEDKSLTALRPTKFEVSVWGESISLKLKPGPIDKVLIERMLNEA